jgi:hypothetical protein
VTAITIGWPYQEEWDTLVTERVRAVETEHREHRRAAGKGVLGRQAALEQRPFDSP